MLNTKILAKIQLNSEGQAKLYNIYHFSKLYLNHRDKNNDY